MDRRERLALAAILVIAALLRLVDLGGPELGLDERGTLVVLAAPSLLEALQGDVAPPLGYVLAHAGLTLEPWLGTEAGVRLGSALAGVLAVPALWGWVRRRAGPRAGLLAAALLAVHGAAIGHAREARFYALLVLLVTLMLHVADRVAERWESRDGVLLGLLGAGVVLTHTLGAAIVGVRGAWLIGQAIQARRRGNVAPTDTVVLALATLLVALAPFAALWRTHAERLVGAPETTAAVSLRTVEGVIRELCGVNVALRSRLGVVALGPLALLGALACVRRGRGAEPAWLVLSVGGALVAFALFPPAQLYTRYFEWALPVWLLLAARGAIAAAALARRARGRTYGKRALSGLAAFGVAALCHATVESRALPPARFRAAGAWLAERVLPGDRVVVHLHRGSTLANAHGARWELQHAAPAAIGSTMLSPDELELGAPPARTFGVIVTTPRWALPEGEVVAGGVVLSRRVVVVEPDPRDATTADAVRRLAAVDRLLPGHDEGAWRWAFARWHPEPR